MQDWLSARAAATPDQVAIIFDDQQITYKQLFSRVGELERSLSKLRDSDSIRRAACLLPNTPEYVTLVHALARMGAPIVPINTRLREDEISYQIHATDCQLLFRWHTQNAIAGTENIELTRYTLGGRSFADEATYLNPANIDLNAAQAIVFTSGTSGQPKGAEITFGNHFYSAMASAYRLGLNPNDRWLSVLPLYHVGGLAVIFRSTLYGITTVLHDRFDIDKIQYSFDHHGITMISLVPTMLYRMLEVGVRWPDSLRLILLGGAAASPELLQRAFEMNLPVAPTYGLTEASSQVATMRPEDARKKPGSVGKPLLFTSVRIADESGQSVPVGEYGEVVVSGPTVMKGYHNNPDATAKAIRDGELYTGDIGYLDGDGDLWLVQRRSDLIVSGGENVYPAEVEQVLREHPAVSDVAVVGVDHPEWGQQVAAAVVLMGGAELTEDDLIAYSREHLAGYKQPRRVLFVNGLPQTASGKVQRGGVRELFTN
jgi:o-succinylbenzoate---CoA ligase